MPTTTGSAANDRDTETLFGKTKKTKGNINVLCLYINDSVPLCLCGELVARHWRLHAHPSICNATISSTFRRKILSPATDGPVMDVAPGVNTVVFNSSL